MDIVEQPPFIHVKTDKATNTQATNSYRRRFIDTGASNELDCNLTELRAASDAAFNNPDPDAREVGFLRHSDFVGHLLRYFYASNQMRKLAPKTVLDVGCGDLQWPFFLHKNRYNPEPGMDYYGLELRATRNWLTALTPAGTPKNQLHCNMNLVRCDLVRDDLSQIPEWPGAFDLVVCFECLEHLPRARVPDAIKKLLNWTAPGGTCLISTPNAGVSRSTAENHLDADGDSREWTYDAKLDLLQEAGFEIFKTFGAFTGITYLPEEVQAKIKTDPTLSAMKEFLDLNIFNAVIAAAYPAHSNNSLMHVRRPRV